MLCHFAHQFPKFVAQFLQRGRTLRRRYREETITDLLMDGLFVLGAGRIIVQFPNEAVTGADMEWNFVNPGFYRLLIQAKQAYGDDYRWTHHHYRGLLKPSPTSGKLQAEDLCKAALGTPATFPLYAFYNPQKTCDLAASAKRAVEGVNLANAFMLEQLLKRATTPSQRTQCKRLGTIFPLLFSLRSLFCPPTILPIGPFALAPAGFPLPLLIFASAGRFQLGVPVPPEPSEIRQRLVDEQSRLAQAARELDLQLPDVPAVSEVIPADIQAIISRHTEGGFMEAEVPLNRWRVIFISGSSRA